MITKLKYIIYTLMFLYCAACELGEWTRVIQDETIHCGEGFKSGDTSNCIYVDLVPDMVIDMPINLGSISDSISILDNGIYDVLFKCYNPGIMLEYKIILKEGIEIAHQLINPPRNADWENVFFGLSYDNSGFAYNLAFGEELCEERYNWMCDSIKYSFGSDESYNRFYVPIKKKTNDEVLIGWIKMRRAYGKYNDSINYRPSIIIDKYAIQKPLL